jgi:hypothetical protein
MNLKSTILAAALLISSAVASAGTPITLTPSTGGLYAGAFTGAAASNTFDLDLTNFTVGTNFFAQVTANFTGGAGYDVTGVTLDGVSFFPAFNGGWGNSGSDNWVLLLPTLSASLHEIVVTGTPLLNTVGFTGSLALNVSAVPEPETYAMMLGGLGLVGFMARRRKLQA